jgi:acyl carrier protein
VQEDTRFKQDLEADSLDLYTLVQELEDSYGVTMSDDQAASITTVGQAVDFVLAHAPAVAEAEGRDAAPDHEPRR